MGSCELDSCDSGQGPVVGSCNMVMNLHFHKRWGNFLTS
jgi:hypothetical protein